MSALENDTGHPSNDPLPLANAAPLIIATIIISALYVGRDVFVPIALAILLSFILAPLVKLLRKWGGGRVLSVVIVVLVAAMATGAVVTIVASQLSQLGANLPTYETTIKNKLDAVKLIRISGFTVGTATTVLKDIGNKITGDPQAAPLPGDASPKAPEPIPVEVHQQPMSPVETLKVVLGPILTILASVGIVVVFAIFILLQREDLRDRFIRLAGVHDLTRATEAINDAAYRLSRLFLMQTAINTSFGVLIGVGLAFIGIPSPLLWGVFAALMRFVPFIGGLISAALPIGLAAAVDPGWSMLVETFALFLVSDLVVGQLIEPTLHGQSTGLSPIAIIIAATFWTWLWGPVGLVLATPLTVCLATLGRHIDRLAFLEVMFGDTPSLSPSQSFYQRILAGDPLEAVDQAEIYLKDHSRIDYCENVVLQALGLAGRDFRNGSLKKEKVGEFRETALEFLETFADLGDATQTGEPAATGQEIICFAGRNGIDDIAASTLAQLLRENGLVATVRSFEYLTQTGGADALSTICISALAVDSRPTNLRFMIRRLRRALPKARFVACFWNLDDTGGVAEEAGQLAGADMQATTLKEVIELCAASQNQLQKAS